MKRLGLVLFIALVAMVGLSPHHLLYDEPFHIEGAVRLVEGWSLPDLLAKPTGSALGPLYPVIHGILSPLTGLRPPAIRVVNLTTLLMSIIIYSLHLRSLGDKSHLQKAFGYLAIPMIWACSGMALTEVPAQLFALIAAVMTAPFLVDLERGSLQPDGLARVVRFGPVLCGGMAGLAMGLAILGRQGYLVATPLLLAPAVFSRGEGKALTFSFSAVGFALLLTAPVFRIWGGLTPPSLSSISGFSILHGCLAFLYLGLMTLFVCPHWFSPLFSSATPRTFSFVASSLAAVVLSPFAPLPMRSVFEGFPGFIQIGARLTLVFAGSLLILAFIYSCFALIKDGMLERLDLSCLVIALLGAATCFALRSQFSSRYLLSSLPFLLYAIRSMARPDRPISLLFAGLGAQLGAVSLASYYQWI